MPTFLTGYLKRALRKTTFQTGVTRASPRQYARRRGVLESFSISSRNEAKICMALLYITQCLLSDNIFSSKLRSLPTVQTKSKSCRINEREIQILTYYVPHRKDCPISIATLYPSCTFSSPASQSDTAMSFLVKFRSGCLNRTLPRAFTSILPFLRNSESHPRRSLQNGPPIPCVRMTRGSSIPPWFRGVRLDVGIQDINECRVNRTCEVYDAGVIHLGESKVLAIWGGIL